MKLGDPDNDVKPNFLSEYTNLCHVLQCDEAQVLPCSERGSDYISVLEACDDNVTYEVWLSASEVADLTGVPFRTIHQWISCGRLVYKIESGRPGRGGKQYRIALSCLDRDAQLRWHQLHPESAPAATVPPADAALQLIRIRDRYGDDELEKAVARAEAVRTSVSLRGHERSQYMEYIAAQLGVSPRTAYRLSAEYKKEGLVAMIDGTKMREGTGYGSKILPEEAMKFIQGLYLQPHKPTGLKCYRTYQEIAKAKGWPVPSKATFYRILSDLPRTVVVMGREGERRWEHTQMPKGKRTKKGMFRNQVWVGDHHQLDFWCEYNGRPVRAWLTAFWDFATNCFVGTAFSIHPSSGSIAAAMASAIFPKDGLPFVGLPQTIYIDNGKDYRSARISGQSRKFKAPDYDPAVKGFCDIMEIEATYCRVMSPWSKPVERAFGLVKDWSREQCAYCGASPEDRPEHVTTPWVKKMCAAGRLPKFEDLPAMFYEWYQRTYLNLPSTALGGKTPLQAYLDTPPARADVPDQHVAFLLFGKGGEAAVHPQGIRKFGPEFWFWAPELAKYVGRKVTVRYDPTRAGELYVFAGGKFLCKVENRELLRMGATQEALTAWMREQARIRKHIREEVSSRRRTVEDVVSELAIAGSSVVTLPMVVNMGHGRVTRLTGLERAARARASSNLGQAGASAPKARDLADEWLRSLAKPKEGSM
jgi:putative transposase